MTIVSESTLFTCIALTSNSIMTKTEFQTRSYQFRTAWLGLGTVKRASLDRILNRAIRKTKWRQAITDLQKNSDGRKKIMHPKDKINVLHQRRIQKVDLEIY